MATPGPLVGNNNGVSRNQDSELVIKLDTAVRYARSTFLQNGPNCVGQLELKLYSWQHVFKNT